jgi:hypothetical protein
MRRESARAFWLQQKIKEETVFFQTNETRLRNRQPLSEMDQFRCVFR